MKFFDFLESSYASSNIEVQQKYTAFKHAETQALSDLTNGQRRFFKFLAYFKVIFCYVLVLIGVKQKPQSAKDIIQTFQDVKNAEALKAKQERQEQIAAEKLTLVSDQPVTS